jgi:hypothetical protein
MRFLDLFQGSSSERIAREYIKALREAGETRRLRYEPETRLVVAYDERGNREQLSFLGNLNREIKSASAEDQAAIYRRYAIAALEVGQGQRSTAYELVRPTLRILLKDSSYPYYIALQNRADFPDAKSLPLVFEHIVGDVIACCIEERDHSLSFVTEEDLANWHTSADTALADAKANVCALPFLVSDPMPQRFVFHDDSYRASRFVNPSMFDGLPVRGNWVAVVPDRDTFFIADSEDLEAVAGLAELAKRQLEKGERMISGLPFVLRGGRWQGYEPPPAIRPMFSNVALQYRAANWTAYKSALEKDLANRAEDLFVASMTIHEEAEAATHYCMAVWQKGVDSILPAVDRVYFYDGDREITRFSQWADVSRTMGTAMQRESGLPEHYRVRSFPDAEQMVAMGAKVLSAPADHPRG